MFTPSLNWGTEVFKSLFWVSWVWAAAAVCTLAIVVALGRFTLGAEQLFMGQSGGNLRVPEGPCGAGPLGFSLFGGLWFTIKRAAAGQKFMRHGLRAGRNGVFRNDVGLFHVDLPNSPCRALLAFIYAMAADVRHLK